MTHKDQVLKKFKKFQAMVANTTAMKIKVLRSNNCEEYLPKEFSKFVYGKGIIRRCSIPRTLEKNGVAKRMNRTIQGDCQINFARSWIIR